VTPVNDAPSFVGSGSPTLSPIDEDEINSAGTLVSAFASSRITDPDAGALKGIAVIGLTEKLKGVWQFSTDDGASWTNLGNPTDTAARLLLPADRVRFVPNANYFGTPQLFFRAWDRTDGEVAGSVVDTSGKRGGTAAYSATQLRAKLAVNAVNDAPVLTLSGSVGYTRNDPPVVLAPSATVTDVDSASFDGGELRVRILVSGSANTLAVGSGFTVDQDDNVFFGATLIGVRTSSGIGTSELKVLFNANATKAVVQALVRSITYSNFGGSAGQRKIEFTVSDGDGGLSAVQTKTVNVT
jgi:trimeric autotransporter adhesin